MGFSGELNAASIRKILALVEAGGIRATRRGLMDLSDAVVKQARSNASNGQHPYGTPTPASPGAGPALISRTLKNSIVRTAVVKNPAGWESKVGLRPGRVPPYRKGGWDSSQYGHALETGLVNGARYPFLGPATHMASIQASIVFARAFSAANWSASSSK